MSDKYEKVDINSPEVKELLFWMKQNLIAEGRNEEEIEKILDSWLVIIENYNALTKEEREYYANINTGEDIEDTVEAISEFQRRDADEQVEIAQNAFKRTVN